MNIVLEVITEYLLANRRLVVPAFGAFMVKESGERVFSELLRTDDGVLISLLREKGLNEMEVAVMIDRFIFEVRHELEQYGYCRLGDVGTLRVEPETSAIRLYPPVYGEALPKHTPYILEPITEDEAEEPVEEPKVEEPKVEEPIEEKKQEKPQPKPKKKSRKKADWVIILAIVTLAVALLVMAYGWYVSMSNHIDTTADDEAMSSLRVLSKEEIEKNKQ